MTDKKLPALPQIGNYSSRKEWEAACWAKISKSSDLLEMLTTPYERGKLIMRAAVMNGLISGRRTGEIAKELWSSRQTVSGIRKSLEKGGYRSYRERSKKERKKRMYAGGGLSSKKRSNRPRGRPVRTKYGTIYIPNL